MLAAAREQFPSIPPSPLHRMSILGHLRQQVSTAVRCSRGGTHPHGPPSLHLHATPGTRGRQADKIKKLDSAGNWGLCEGGGGGKWEPWEEPGPRATPREPQWLRPVSDVLGSFIKCCYKSGGCGA